MQVKDIIRRQYCSVSEQDTITTLLGKCRRTKHFYAVVLDQNGHYKGMADKKKLLSLNIDASKTKVSKVLTKVPQLSMDDSLEEAARLFYAAEMHALPVVEGREVKGVVWAAQVLVGLRNKLRGRKASEMNSKNLFTLTEDAPINKVTSCFKSKGIGRVPVVNENGNLISICTIEDILYAYHMFPARRGGKLQGKKSGGTPAEELLSKGKLPVSNLATSDVVTLRGSDSLTKAVDLFAQYGISSVVVTNGNKPIGIVAIKDLLRIVR